MDRPTGYIQAIPYLKAGLTTEEAAKLFLDNDVCFMGVPLDILFHNNKLITNEFFMTLCEMLGIEQHCAVICRPKGNGRAENLLRLSSTYSG